MSDVSKYYILILYINIDDTINVFLRCGIYRLRRRITNDHETQVLQLNPILIPAINDKLASLYTVHKSSKQPTRSLAASNMAPPSKP